MGFFEAVGTGFKKSFDFQGRATRPEYWWFALFVFSILCISFFLDGMLGSEIDSTGPVELVVIIVVLLPNLAVTIRRLHDIDRTGWWIFLNIIPYVGFIILSIFCALRGTDGPNRFGEDPKMFDTA
jgi:uncharacterized membrane protein YhaH (DUF805 family)